LEETLEGWHGVRQGVIDEVRHIPAGCFDFRPTPHSRTVRELVQHILEVAMMMTGALTRRDSHFHRASWRRLLVGYARPAWRARTKPALLRRGQLALYARLLGREPALTRRIRGG
jgi:uncharacterized damage-inducible protein DinB